MIDVVIAFLGLCDLLLLGFLLALFATAWPLAREAARHRNPLP